ncbi:MAG TPA: TetR/AcrR family transcriptional regulator [Kofleriaceae bacterium]
MRTRTALRDALAKLLHDRLFEDITLNDIAEASGLNRGTIYKHYADKFALLDGWIADDLRERLFAAMSCATSCADKVSGVVAATCECSRWATTLGRPDDRLLRPIVEARIRALVQHAVTFALAQKVVRAVGKPELVVPMAAAAVCGAALAWNGKHLPQHVAATVAALDHLIVPSAQLPKMTASISF